MYLIKTDQGWIQKLTKEGVGIVRNEKMSRYSDVINDHDLTYFIRTWICLGKRPLDPPLQKITGYIIKYCCKVINFSYVFLEIKL